MNTKNELKFDNLENMDNILIFVGASGSGKTTLAHYLRVTLDIPQLITTTTREPRYGEIHGVDYYFVEHKQFSEALVNGMFVESTEYAGNLYGLTKSEINKNAGNVSCVITDVNGARALADLYPKRVLIFWLESDPFSLVRRLRKRKESFYNIINRLTRAFNNKEFNVPSAMFVDVSFTTIHSSDDLINNFGIVYYKLLTAEYQKNSEKLSELQKEKEINKNVRKTLL